MENLIKTLEVNIQHFETQLAETKSAKIKKELTSKIAETKSKIEELRKENFNV